MVLDDIASWQTVIISSALQVHAREFKISDGVQCHNYYTPPSTHTHARMHMHTHTHTNTNFSLVILFWGPYKSNNFYST